MQPHQRRQNAAQPSVPERRSSRYRHSAPRLFSDDDGEHDADVESATTAAATESSSVGSATSTRRSSAIPITSPTQSRHQHHHQPPQQHSPPERSPVSPPMVLVTAPTSPHRSAAVSPPPPHIATSVNTADAKMFNLFRPPRDEVDEVVEGLQDTAPVALVVSPVTADGAGPSQVALRRGSFQTQSNSGVEHPAHAEKERRPTWLELFYDLFFVAILRILSHSEVGYAHYFGDYAALFAVVWWTWMMVTLYDTKYDTDDIYHRLGKLAQMLAIGGLALSVETAFSDVLSANIFACSYVIIRCVILLNYTVALYFKWRPTKIKFYSSAVGSGDSLAPPSAPIHTLTGHEDPTALKRRRRLALRRILPLICSNVSAVALFALSMLLNTPSLLYYRIPCWLVSFMIDAVCHWVVSWRLQQVPFRGSHLPERMGLFTIIVVGEDVIGVLVEAADRVSIFLSNGSADDGVVFGTWGYPCTLLICFVVITFCWWWMYFDDISNSSAEWGRRQKRVYLYDRFRHLWIYMHLPLHLLLSVLGVTMNNAMRVGEKYAQQTVVAATQGGRPGKPRGALLAAKASSSATAVNLSVETIVVQLFALTGALHIFSAFIKVMNTYQNDATVYDRIGYSVRVAFGVVFVACILIPANINLAKLDETEFVVYTVLGLTVCTVFQVVCDIWVLTRNSRVLFQVLVRTFSDSGMRDQPSGFSRTNTDQSKQNAHTQPVEMKELRPHRPPPAVPGDQQPAVGSPPLQRLRSAISSAINPPAASSTARLSTASSTGRPTISQPTQVRPLHEAV